MNNSLQPASHDGEPPESAWERWTDVPIRRETFPDGRQVVVLGNIEAFQRDLGFRCDDTVPLCGRTVGGNDDIAALKVDCGESLEDLAADVEHGEFAAVWASRGILFESSAYVGTGHADVLLPVAAVVRDVHNHELVGFWVIDSSAGNIHRFVTAEQMQSAWLALGGVKAVSDSSPIGRREV